MSAHAHSCLWNFANVSWNFGSLNVSSFHETFNVSMKRFMDLHPYLCLFSMFPPFPPLLTNFHMRLFANQQETTNNNNHCLETFRIFLLLQEYSRRYTNIRLEKIVKTCQYLARSVFVFLWRKRFVYLKVIYCSSKYWFITLRNFRTRKKPNWKLLEDRRDISHSNWR